MDEKKKHYSALLRLREGFLRYDLARDQAVAAELHDSSGEGLVTWKLTQ